MSLSFFQGFLPTTIWDDASLTPFFGGGPTLRDRNVTGLSLRALTKMYWLAKSFDYEAAFTYTSEGLPGAGSVVGSDTVLVSASESVLTPPPQRIVMPGFRSLFTRVAGPMASALTDDNGLCLLPVTAISPVGSIPTGIPVDWLSPLYTFSPGRYYVSRSGASLKSVLFIPALPLFDVAGGTSAVGMPKDAGRPNITPAFVSIMFDDGVTTETSSPVYFYEQEPTGITGSLTIKFNNFWP